MRTINLLLQEARQRERQARAEERRVKNKKSYMSRGRSRTVAQENTYCLYVSGKPTEEKRDMLHVRASLENRKMLEAFSAKVREALDNGGRYEGKLAQWRCIEHWSDKK